MAAAPHYGALPDAPASASPPGQPVPQLAPSSLPPGPTMAGPLLV